jgi:hypothetical protein
MARRDQALTADVYGNQYSTAQLQEIRRKLAKRANNSLRDLARNSSPITGEVYNSYGAAVDALDYLKARNRRYFSESLTLTENRTVLKAEIQRLQYFLTRPSHTVKGQREIEQKRIETFEKKGIHFASGKEFYQFLNSGTFQSLRKLQYSSEQLIEDYERAREQGMTNDQVMEKLSNALDAFRKGEKVTQKNLWEHLDISPFDNSANG